jgi:hypothetical protein
LPEELARRAAAHADLRGHVGRLVGVAAAGNRYLSDPISTPAERDLPASSHRPSP